MFRLTKYITIFLALFIGLSFFYASAPAQAQTYSSSGDGISINDGGLENLPGMDLDVSIVYCLFLRFMTWFFSFALVLAIIFLVYNGLRYITSSGNPDELAKIHKNFWWTLIGVVIVLLATSILLMIANFLGAFTVNFKIYLLPFEEMECEITWWADLINSVGNGLGVW